MKNLVIFSLSLLMLIVSMNGQIIGSVFTKEMSMAGDIILIQELTTIVGNENTFTKFSSASVDFKSNVSATGVKDPSVTNYVDCSYRAAFECFTMFSFDNTNGCILYTHEISSNEVKTCGSSVVIHLYVNYNPDADNCIEDPITTGSPTTTTDDATTATDDATTATDDATTTTNDATTATDDATTTTDDATRTTDDTTTTTEDATTTTDDATTTTDDATTTTEDATTTTDDATTTTDNATTTIDDATTTTEDATTTTEDATTTTEDATTTIDDATTTTDDATTTTEDATTTTEDATTTTDNATTTTDDGTTTTDNATTTTEDATTTTDDATTTTEDATTTTDYATTATDDATTTTDDATTTTDDATTTTDNATTTTEDSTTTTDDATTTTDNATTTTDDATTTTEGATTTTEDATTTTKDATTTTENATTTTDDATTTTEDETKSAVDTSISTQDTITTNDPTKTTVDRTTTTEDPIKTNTCTCGTENNHKRIVGGTGTAVNQYPYIVRMIVTIVGNGRTYSCGASILSETVVLTAAHCLINDGTVALANNVQLQFGAHDTKNPPSSLITLTAKELILHEEYDNKNHDNDIAVVILQENLNFSSEISPVCLPYNLDMTTLPGKISTVMGWGTFYSGSMAPNALRHVELGIIANENCETQFPGLNGRITENMFCAYSMGKDTCHGDSGGPLVYKQDGRDFEIGVVSWGIGCGGANAGVYARVVNYLTWIEEKTKQSFCKP